MKIFMLTIGTRGDVQPFIALGRALKAEGYSVTLATSSSFETLISGHGLDYGYISNDLLDLMDSAEGRQAMEETVGILGTVRSMAKLAQEGNRINRKILIESWEAAEKAQPDLIIYHPKAFGASHIAERLRIPAVMAVMQPMIVPTSAMPPIGIPALKLGGWYNRLGYRLIKMGYNAYRGMTNTFREETLKIDKLSGSDDVLSTLKGQPVPVMHAFSQHILPRPHDWPDYAHLTGYWFLEDSESWKAPADLLAFLDAGDAPVYIGFGSMAGRDPQRLGRIVIEALQKAKVRGVIATGWGGINTDDLPDTIFRIEQAPHDWLFPRMTAVVHHGGAGTTAATLRASRPAVICSFMGDQPFWGNQIQAMGLGSGPIPQKRLTADRLAAAIIEVTTNPAIRQNAEVLGERIRQEDGIGNAVTLIEKLIKPERPRVRL